MAKKDIVEFDLLAGLEDQPIEPKAKQKKSSIPRADANINVSDVLVARLVGSNIDWKKIGNKNLFLKMAEIFNADFDRFLGMTIAVRTATSNKRLPKGMTSTNVDWDRFERIPTISKFIEDKKKEQRKIDVIKAQAILRDSDSERDDIARANAILKMNSDLIGNTVQTNSNEGLIIKHVTLSKIEEHLEREKEVNSL